MTLDEQLLYKLKQTVLDNLENEQFSVKNLSRMVGMSRSHLHRKLKKLKGQSISQFIRAIRLNEALKLLNEDVATTAEIAYRVGFNSPSYFHKCFLDYFGHPPSEAKQIFQNGQNNKNSTKEKNQSSFNYKIISISIIVLLLSFLTIYIFKKEVISEPIEKSIAILPFNNLSSDEENQHFADGLVEDLLNRLSTVKEFKIISRTSSDTYRERGKKKVAEIAEELGVSYIVEGSVQKYDNKARITVQLIDAKNDNHIWIKTFDRDVADVFKVQSEIAMVIVSGLSTVLTEQQIINIQKNQTNNPRAFEYYQLGRHHWGMRTFEGLKTSITYFNQAITEDPYYALAYAGLADTYYLMVWFDYKDKQKSNRDKAEELTLKALELDNRLTEAYTVLASIYSFVDWDWKAGEKTFLQGIGYNTNFSNIHHRYSEHLSITGRHKEAREHINIALKLDPLSFIVRQISAEQYYDRGFFKEALAENQICSDLFMNKFHWYTHNMNFEIFCQLGDSIAALENIKLWDSISIYGKSNPRLWDSLSEVSGYKGLIRRKADLEVSPFAKANLYGLVGDDEKAIHWLEKSFENETIIVGFPSMYNFKNLHSNTRFITLLDKMNLPWQPETSK
jgi:TolB-like protein/AraC-like DNA-binding protein